MPTGKVCQAGKAKLAEVALVKIFVVVPKKKPRMQYTPEETSGVYC